MSHSDESERLIVPGELSPLLSIRDLAVDYGTGQRRFRAVEHIDLTLSVGQTLGIVGESGSGKSTIGRAILGLADPVEGSITLDGRDITHRKANDRIWIANRLGVVFQDPFSSLNPAMTVGASLMEPLRTRHRLNKEEARARVARALSTVGLSGDAMSRYPQQFSGGQRQRIAIARAIVPEPDLIVCDEAVSALDLSIQAQVINLLREIQTSSGVGLVFISHDLSVVRHIADNILVLRHGRIIEFGPAAQVYESPRESYTRELLAASPVPNPAEQRARREARHALNL